MPDSEIQAKQEPGSEERTDDERVGNDVETPELPTVRWVLVGLR